MPHAEELAAACRTPMIVAVGSEIIGIIGVADQVREDAAEMVRRLHAAGVKKVVMLTGDTRLVTEAVARETGVDEVHASLLPEDKLDKVAELQRQGYTVAMGAAGSAVAVETADIALMGDNLLKLPESISLAKRTVNVMRQNIVVALVTVLALLAGVFGGSVTMSIGMLVHEASVLIVIVNAMRLLRNAQGQTAMAKADRAPARASKESVSA